MLRHLYIKDFTLIDQLDIDFYPGFSVITGETGAGKSIILGALGLLLGNRADVKQIKNGEKKCVIEAHFGLADSHLERLFSDNDIDYDAQDCILRREINANGKSRAFVNDSPVSIAVLKELGEHLIDIHSQHQNLLLQKDDFMLGIVDVVAKNGEVRRAFAEAYEEQKTCKRELDDLTQQIERDRQNEDFLRFQYQELSKDEFKEGEQEQLEQDSEMLAHAEEIKQVLFDANNVLADEDNNVASILKNIASNLNSIESVYAPARELAARVESAYIEIKDIADEINGGGEKIEFNPALLEEINGRLDRLYALQQKYHLGSIEELNELKQKIADQLGLIDNGSDELDALKERYERAYKECLAKAKQLTQTREKAARTVEKELKQRLVPLGIPNVRFEVSMEEKPLSADGADKLQFMFSANKNSLLQPISQIASGGEIARVMLSLKAMISGVVKLPTIIFDEIDTGVSGRVAEQMASIMKEMGDKDRQVISITHLPQIAAMGTTHYKVSKEDYRDVTLSRMTKLTDDERIKEIAQMLSGSDITPAAIENAKSLLRI